MFVEKRKYYRLQRKFELKVAKWSFPLKKQKWYEIYSVDIGAGGIRFEVPFAPEKGEILQFKLLIPGLRKHYPGFSKVFALDTEEFFGLGEVIWVQKINEKKFEVGLQFSNIFEDDWQALVDFLLKHKE